MSKAAAFSDVHLDAFTANQDRFEDISLALDGMVESIRDIPGLDAVFFLGDLCNPDTPKTSRSIAKVVDMAMTLSDGGIHSYWMTGNHDVVEDGSGDHTLMALDGLGSLVHVIDKPQSIGWGKWEVLFLPFTPQSHRYDPVEFIKQMPRSDGGNDVIVMGHLNLEGISPGSETTDMPRGREVFWPLDAIKEHLPGATMIGGHYHKRQVYKGVNICGSMERLNFGEESHEPAYLMLEG